MARVLTAAALRLARTAAAAAVVRPSTRTRLTSAIPPTAPLRPPTHSLLLPTNLSRGYARRRPGGAACSDLDDDSDFESCGLNSYVEPAFPLDSDEEPGFPRGSDVEPAFPLDSDDPSFEEDEDEDEDEDDGEELDGSKAFKYDGER